MNAFIYILLIIVFSCSYPDIDSVPNFNFKNRIIENCKLINFGQKCELDEIISRL